MNIIERVKMGFNKPIIPYNMYMAEANRNWEQYIL